MEGVRPIGRYMGPRGGPRACAWDADAVQSVASIELSVLGNIALWIKSENPDLVENVSTADVDVLGHQWADWAIIERRAERYHHATVMSIQESMHR